MQAVVYFVDESKTTADQRWKASCGGEIPRKCYRKMAARRVSGDPLAVCEVLFRQLQSERPFNQTGEAHRSMCIGDRVEIDGKIYLCDRVGFRRI